jgi:Arc/MetJ-type ribon-helix-helix transcriptional regulator
MASTETRITQDVRIDKDLDAYIRKAGHDPFRGRIKHGYYSDVVNDALRAWKKSHEDLTAMSQE